MEDVKAAMGGASATQATVTTLQALLGLETGQKPNVAPQRATTAKGTTARPQKGTASRTKKAQPVAISEDAPKPLSPREKYALATDTVNTGLRVLNEAVKDLSKATGSLQNATPSTPTSTPRGALQPRSNNVTPRRTSPEKTKSDGKRVVDTSSTGSDGSVIATAECTRMAFAFLRSADTQKLGVREMPRLQLETGMLAMVGKLIPLGLESMAIKELRHVKRRLESLYAMKQAPKPASARSRTVACQAEKETLASLLYLNACFEDDHAALSLTVTYCMHVLKVIGLSRRPSTIEEAAQYLPLERTNSPADLLLRLAKDESQAAKAAKQLEALSQIITSLCSSPSSSSDAIAMDPAKHVSPGTALRLQAIALQLRQRWWNIAGHDADVNRELLEPFVRCAFAFVRRSASSQDTVTMYETICQAFESLESGGTSEATQGSLFSIHSLLSQHAERAGRSQEAIRWATSMSDDCRSLESNHARKLSAIVRQACILLQTSEDQRADLDGISAGLGSKLTGTVADFDSLLHSLRGLASVSSTRTLPEDARIRIDKISILSAAFALRYARSYPGKGTDQVVAFVNAALRCSRSTDDVLSWVTPEAASIFIQAGTLKRVAQVANSRPLDEAWQASSDAVSLGRICRALLLSKVRSQTSTGTCTVVDDEQLGDDQRGILLEMQLDSAVQLSTKTKYHSALRQIISDLLRTLTRIYTLDSFPIRRARVAIEVLRLNELCPELLMDNALEPWQVCTPPSSDAMAHDVGLQPYLEDLKAALIVSKAFHNSNPVFEDLEPAIASWSKIRSECASGSSVRDRIACPLALAQQLEMLANYFGMKGDEHARLSVLSLLHGFQQLPGSRRDHNPAMVSDFTECYLQLGHAERAQGVLAAAESKLDAGIEGLQFRLARAEHFLATDDLVSCARALAECKTQREIVAPDTVTRERRREYELLHARAWLISSRHASESGLPHEALTAAKRSVKVLNSIWAALERADGARRSDSRDEMAELEASDAGVSGLTKGVSKLNLTPKDDTSSTGQKKRAKGAAFWPIVPVLIKALMHLSDMYSHHGLFSEANYYSERAISIAESVSSDTLLSRARSHRVRLLVLAGRLEEADLCLTQDETTALSKPSFAAVEQICAQAAVRAKGGSSESVVALLEEAERMVDDMSSESFIARWECFGASNDRTDNAKDIQPSTRARPATRAPIKKPPGRANTSKAMPKKRVTAQVAPSGPQSSCCVLSKLKADILLQMIRLRLKLGEDVSKALSEVVGFADHASISVRIRIAEHIHLMAQANATLEMDVTMNVLAESTLSLPSFSRQPDAAAADSSSDTSVSRTSSKKAPARSKKPVTASKSAPSSSAVIMLRAASAALRLDVVARSYPLSTVEAHLTHSLSTNAEMLLSAVCEENNAMLVQPGQQGLSIDLPRMKALECERQACIADKPAFDSSEPLSWPEFIENSESQSSSAKSFREDYVNIIPKAWTAVSLCLNEDGSELYIARYRAQQEPLILRLPFSRHKPEDVDEEAFDYAKGKAELQEIIELSNYTCHNSRNMDAKGAKSTWWSDREALDRRMHELLINMESIWLGGFRSILSKEQRDADLLARFRRSFEDILDRYLPSRSVVKTKCKKLALDDQVLELFVGLGHDEDGSIDLDEPLADLLYFVVDMLQFSGERNAYDEIDFDSMAVDVLDALRTYHEAIESEKHSSQHLILVLDRRLQAFPWENMPCLQGESVSRVGSMQSLRDCILAMRATEGKAAEKLPNDGEGCHIVARGSGSYILNPSSDLKATQTMLSPVLSSLKDSLGQPWMSMVNEAPDERRFSTALQDSKVLLYFGHGAGSQYIRARAIKRLERCSEVVWLMGCSSGAVTEHGDLEPAAVPHAYLLAGGRDQDGAGRSGKCLSVVATLWDVTDKDIDRFSLAVGEDWGLWPSSEQSKLPAKTPKKRAPRQTVAPSTPQQVPKTPKTPRVHKTPAAAVAKTPARSRSGGGTGKYDGKQASLTDAVARSRETCYLRYLNGAAPVVYGVPVYLGD